MGMSSPRLNRKIQIQRPGYVSDGSGGMTPTWENVGPALSAQRTDVKDAERIVAAGWQSKLVTRFVVRSSEFARSIRRSDRLVHEGVAFEISGIKEVPPGSAFIEITAESDGIA
ncbi:head-tail adaptor protein [Cereibacter azotoformans]|uniref:head-tail adaptor protein n=1 Tax=Cereibacter azotoformans TaxID=43057 RepID=UPI000C6E4864|nr:head-tail adaptor protein [Cereibacter azotoformans]